MKGSVTVPSSRSVPRCLPVRDGRAGDVEDVVEELEGEADPAPEARRGVGVARPASSAPRRHAASNSRAVFSSQRRR